MKTPDPLEKLISEYGDASFDCGEAPSDDYVAYEVIAKRCAEAKKRLLEYIEDNYQTKDK